MYAGLQNTKYKALTEKIIKVFYRVYNQLGYGFLEKVYENAMMITFRKEGISAVPQSPIKVFYEGEIVGEYFADILVDDKVIVEIKAAKTLAAKHEAQLLNYLKATDYEVGLLLNFGPTPEIKRKVFDNHRK
jgi:GxxExxY protein